VSLARQQTGKFEGDTYLFTNVEIGAQEFPWKEAYAGPQGVSIVTEVACAAWLEKVGLPEVAEIVCNEGNDGKCE
jgi:hypothetical protein